MFNSAIILILTIIRWFVRFRFLESISALSASYHSVNLSAKEIIKLLSAISSSLQSKKSNSNFLISISLQTDSIDLRYFKLRLFDLSKFIVGNIRGLRYYLAEKSMNLNIRVFGKYSILLLNKF